jgi:hypothetical protein
MSSLSHFSQEEINKLRELWVRQFSRALGKVSPNIDAVFRVEFVGVKDKTFEEAKAAILIAADEIITELEEHQEKGEIIMKLKKYLLSQSPFDYSQIYSKRQEEFR